MENDLKTGIVIGLAICVPGIVFMPPISVGSVGSIEAALVCAAIGGLALVTSALRRNSFAVGVGMTSIIVLGGYALLAGVIDGLGALGVAILTLIALIAVVVRVLPNPQGVIS